MDHERIHERKKKVLGLCIRKEQGRIQQPGVKEEWKNSEDEE